MKRRIVPACMAVCAVLPALALGAGPGIEAALSVKSHATGDYGLDLLGAVEPRAGGVSELVVTFDTAIDPATVAGHIAIRDETGTSYPGFSWALEGAVLTIVPDPALGEHCFTVDFAGLESTAGEVSDARVQFIALEGDITGEGVVNSVDYSSVKPWYGAAVDEETFLYDLTVSDPVVNAIDGSFVKPRFGHSVSCPQEVVTAELAGNSLETYPYFEYVRAFNEDATVEVAVDPARFPGIVGRTCDIHVVGAKDAAEWEADPALLDVTPGGALEAVFGGATIQGNTFVVTGPYDLDADAGIGLGVGYDVVLDCDQDGQLGAGDYIDGLGDEAGLYAVADTTAPGPMGVTEIEYSAGAWLTQIAYYPTDIALLGELPLVTIGHGGGHYYTWYGHIGHHLASHGCVAMSYKNNTAPGIEVAATTTLENTDYLIGAQGVIAGGVLNGHIDSSRIIWIGHGRGGEGIVRAYDRLFTGAYTPDHFGVDDVVLLSPMAPTNFLGTYKSHPHDASFHLWTAAADADVSGAPGSPLSHLLALHDRATNFRHSTILQGVGHGDFLDYDGSSFGTGPCLIGRENAHLILKGLFLPLVRHYAEGNLPAIDFFWRQWEAFKPIGAPTQYCEVTGGDAVVVTRTYQNGVTAAKFVIDDYQAEPGPGVSSSGGAVSYSVTNVHEDILRDTDAVFAWLSTDPMNGMIHAQSTDTSRGVVFDWDGKDAFYELEIIPAERDFTDDKYLSFRACQGTRHPYTVAEIGDLTFTVTLRDAGGTTGSIDIGAYGGGIEEPYQREGYGVGTGWFNEFETIRIRLTDFLANGSGLDLADIEAVRFEFGPSFGSSQGRIGLDEIELTGDDLPE